MTTLPQRVKLGRLPWVECPTVHALQKLWWLGRCMRVVDGDSQAPLEGMGLRCVSTRASWNSDQRHDQVPQQLLGTSM
jgi:hypothetical protein